MGMQAMVAGMGINDSREIYIYTGEYSAIKTARYTRAFGINI